MLKELLKNFPFETPRDIQVTMLEQIAENWDTDSPIFLEGPPGTGKTAIAMTIAKWLWRAEQEKTFIATVTTQLQDQYVRDFGQDVEVLMGKSHFDCFLNCKCSEGYYLKDQFKKAKSHCENCPYIIARDRALKAPITLANYHSLVYNSFAHQVSSRRLLILDEGHSAENFLMDFGGVSLNKQVLPLGNIEFPDYPNEPYKLRIADFNEILEEVVAYCEEMENGAPHKADQYGSLAKRCKYVANAVDKYPDNYVVTECTKFKLIVKPIYVKNHARLLLDLGEKVIFLSATLMDNTRELSGSLGINNRVWITTNSTFPIKNRKIYIGDIWDMSEKGRLAGNWKLMIPLIKQIFAKYPNDKGIILCPSFSMVNFLLGELNESRVCAAVSKFQKKAYEKHLNSKEPTVLITASHWEGIDLKDDLSRFQIIPKLPYLVPDPQVNARSWDWKNWQTALRLSQAYGRSIRSETDWAETWIFDNRILNRGILNCLPKWVEEALVNEKGV